MERKTMKTTIYREILVTANMGLLAVDLSGKILDANPYYCKLIGYDRSELRSMNLRDLRIDSPDTIINDIEEAKKAKYSVRELIHCCKDGGLINVRVTANFLRSGILSYFIQDITEEKKAEKFREEYTTLAVHDLKTPITTIKLSMGIIRSLAGDQLAVLQRALDAVERSSQEALDMLDNMLQASKLQIVGYNFSRYLLDLNDLVYDIVAHTVPPSDQRRLNISTIRISLPIMGEREYLKRALVNIVQNALKYSPRHERIELKLARIKDKALFSITDHGPGIGEEELVHLFEKYYRGISSERRSGTGLGLYISRQIIEALGGEINVESKLGEGSTFVIIFPLA